MTELHPLDDGKTHINVYSKAFTKLGKMLTNVYTEDHESNYPHTSYGPFRTIEGLWFFLKLKPFVPEKDLNVFKNLDAFSVRDLYSKIDKILKTSSKKDEYVEYQKTASQSDEFRLEIKKAIKDKILKNDVLKFLLYESELPIVHYYWYGDHNQFKQDRSKVTVKELDEYKWITEFITLIRSSLQNGELK